MATVRLPITARSRSYGYLIWTKSEDEKMKQLIGNRDNLRIFLCGNDLLEKRVDWKYRRISLGYKHTRRLPEAATWFVVIFDQSKGLVITIE